jgi:hypothetical protein
MKHIQITFPNGEVWQVPAEVVAKDRAEFYSQLDFERGHASSKEDAYVEELNYALNDPVELIDYLRNNMDWSDVQAHAVRVPVAQNAYDYGEAFDDARFEVKDGEA